MATSTAAKFSYQRLKNDGGFDEHDQYQEEIERAILHVRARSWPTKFKSRVHIRKRFKVKIPSLKRFLRRRLARPVMVSWAKTLKRLKDSQAHFGDLFAGNYLFMQVTPTPPLKLKYSSSSSPSSSSSYGYAHHHKSLNNATTYS